jgi:hypothetical protein
MFTIVFLSTIFNFLLHLIFNKFQSTELHSAEACVIRDSFVFAGLNMCSAINVLFTEL